MAMEAGASATETGGAGCADAGAATPKLAHNNTFVVFFTDEPPNFLVPAQDFSVSCGNLESIILAPSCMRDESSARRPTRRAAPSAGRFDRSHGPALAPQMHRAAWRRPRSRARPQRPACGHSG